MLCREMEGKKRQLCKGGINQYSTVQVKFESETADAELKILYSNG